MTQTSRRNHRQRRLQEASVISMKVLVTVSNPDEACSFYRACGPWSALAKKHRDVQVVYSKNPMWADIRQVDLVYVQRAASQDYLKIVLTAKDLGVPVWLDYDDDLINLPRDNPNFHYYSRHTNLLKELVGMADLVTVTTRALQRSLSQYSKNVEVIPNALDEVLIKWRSFEARNKIVMWRGTATHTRDVGSVAPELVANARAFQEYQWLFLGADPCAWQVSELMPKVTRLTEQMNPLTFFRTMITLAPEVLVAPLHDCPFNRAKSNIAAIEGALAGAAIIAPDWEEWRIPGVVTYKNSDEFKELLSRMLSGQINTNLKAQETWNYVRDELSLSLVNERRLRLARELVLPNGKSEQQASGGGARTPEPGVRN